MGIVKEKGIYLFEEFLDYGLVAGFSDTSYDGLDREEDFKKILSSLDLTCQSLFYLDQIHGAEVISPGKEPPPLKGDALISDRKQELLAIKTADCLPLFFYQSKKDIIAAIHLGWKPARAGMISAFIDTLTNDFDSDLNDALIAIGP
ncbi:polyphenol oxidase family protein, partial [Candidatus Omnitrophota bacterium]